jgi:hypothetical protein
MSQSRANRGGPDPSDTIEAMQKELDALRYAVVSYAEQFAKLTADRDHWRAVAEDAYSVRPTRYTVEPSPESKGAEPCEPSSR